MTDLFETKKVLSALLNEANATKTQRIPTPSPDHPNFATAPCHHRQQAPTQSGCA